MHKAFLYQNSLKEWEWKIVNGKTFESKKIVGASTEGYKRRAKCIENYILITGDLKRIPLFDEKGSQQQITTSKGRGY